MESMDMAQEQKPSRKVLFKEGWRKFRITSCSEEVKSKQGNSQYVLTIQDTQDHKEGNLYAVSEPKKRWMLKEILDACGIEHKEGIYKFQPPLSRNLVSKEIMGLVEHEDNKWVNRDGENVITKQHRIVEIRTVGMVDVGDENIDPSKIPDPKPVDPKEIVGWDDDVK